jgi:outer membrane protein OmpA-like peptidoglycan-associated protein
MVNKKIKLFTALCMLLSAGAIAQTESGNTGYMSGGYNIYDSSVISNKKMGQQNEFWNNSYSFPAKPRNMVEIGISTGLATVSGDVSTKAFTAPNFGITVRKSLGYLFSLRAEYINTTMEGQNWKASEGFSKNPAFGSYFATVRDAAGNLVNQNASGARRATRDYVYYNYRTKLQDLSLQGIFTFNNVRFHKAKTGLVIYGGAGIGASLYRTKINAFNDANGGANYSALFNATQIKYAKETNLYKKRKDIRKDLKAGMDDTYETDAESTRGSGASTPGIDGKTLKPSGNVLAGIAFKLGKRINLAIEDRFTFVKTDLLDGQQWQEQPRTDAAQTRDFDSYNYASVRLNFNLGGKSVEPLYWLNPLDYAYSELNEPKHMKLPKPSFEDADGDGVLDQLDREPNTPAGCPVDTHGVTKDTDGDGVPDCKDKQLITPTECQPVNADGIGKCPDPKCCENITTIVDPVICPSDYPSLTFKGNVQTLSNDVKAMLASVASKMKASPTCNVSVTGYPEASKAAQAVCNKRNEAIKMYLVEKEGISADRISTNCEVSDGANKNTVDIKSN